MKYLTIFVLIFAFIAGSCGKNEQKGPIQINGAGATFPFPLYSKWFDEYSKINKDAKFNYQSIGSGGGIKQVTEGTVDFGATDSPMNAEEMKNAETKSGTKIYHIPTVLGAVVLTYNLPGLEKPLNLSGENIADIYLGKIKKWNDPKLAKDNPDTKLPDKDITVVFRTDGSGTSYIFTDFLGSISPEAKEKIGVSKTPKFDIGQGGKGNEGVTGVIKQLEYSIGYVELIYAISNNLKYANVKNPEGEFITPTLESVTKAGDVTLSQMPETLTMSIINAKGKGAYPISSYTYLIVYEKNKDEAKGKLIKSFLEWALADGQKFAKDLGYAPLPADLTKKALDKVKILK
ncbi:MAG: phosphate ABC transporter substrate-binding protein PstS [Ignavibacteria bacterium]|nr:phosphate ABC transporter substrate-binding protein PstS [Ignavibacteria bacterium]